MYWRIFKNARTIAFAVCVTGLAAETLYGCHIMPACSWPVSIKPNSKVRESIYWERIRGLYDPKLVTRVLDEV